MKCEDASCMGMMTGGTSLSLFLILYISFFIYLASMKNVLENVGE